MLHGTARGSVVLLESTVINYIEIDSFIYVAIECCALCTLSEVSVHTYIRCRSDARGEHPRFTVIGVFTGFLRPRVLSTCIYSLFRVHAARAYSMHGESVSAH